MSPDHSTKPSKPNKPYPKFPLFPPAAGPWAKKIRGRMVYFGAWADPDAALAKYLEQKDALHAGRKPRESTEGTTVKDVANAFLNTKQPQVDTGELSPRTWAVYKGPKLFTAEEICRLIDNATTQHKAMLLLGINAGFGNTDCAALPLTALDLNAGFIDFARPKTGVPRRCPLWPETDAAIRDVLVSRKEPKDQAPAGLVFITRTGQSWAKGKAENPLSDMTAKLLRKLGINGRQRLGFYALRHTFRTVADEVKDQPAADYSMGY